MAQVTPGPNLDVRPFKQPNNVDIFNAIRKNSTVDYQKRIPAATKANVQNTINNLLNYRPQMNEFIDALVNQIGLIIVRNILWTNPLAKFKRGMLQYGDTIEEINVGLLTAKRYDPDREYLEKDIFGQERPDVQSSFHKVNRQDFYKLTVNEALLRRAFFDEYGLSNFVVNLMTAPTTSDNWDEFLLTASLFEAYYLAGGFYKVNVPDIETQTSDSADSKFTLRRMREFAENLKFISTHYNASGMPVAAQPDELELFLTPEANAAMDVEALSGAFNVGYADMPTRKTIIPKEHFNVPGAQAVLTTRDFFVIADQRIDTTVAINPVGLHTNYFLHHWQVISASRFVPAILFTTEAGDVINIPDTPVSAVHTPIQVVDRLGVVVTAVKRGELYNVYTYAETTPANGENDAVRFMVEGAESPRTYITQTGMLHVSADDPSTSLTVWAVATDDESKTLSATVAVDGDLAILWPDPEVKTDSDSDGLFEVTPKAPTFTTPDKVKIPTTEGVDYKNDATVVTGTQTIAGAAGTTMTITAVAQAGSELKSGATASWVFTKA